MLLLLLQALEAGVTATASIAEDNDTGISTAVVAVSASASPMEGSDTGTATGSVRVSSAASVTEGSDTSAATASVGVSFTTSATEADDTGTATAIVALAAIASATEADDTSDSQANVAVGAALSQTDTGDTLVSLGVVQSPVTISAGRANLIYELALLHGLVPGNPLTVSPTERSAGNVLQTISGIGTVTVTTVASDVLHGDLDTWIDALAAIHGLTVPLVTTDATRVAGTVLQTLISDGTTTVVELV